MHNLPLTFNRTCTYVLAFNLTCSVIYRKHPPLPVSFTLLSVPNVHSFTFDGFCQVQAIYLSAVRLALDAYTTAGLARVNRNSKMANKFYPYSLNSSVLS
jgi:hypothetical protein